MTPDSISLPSAPDVLVIGGGAAALCAAISARRAGLSVLLLEQAPRWRRGGNTRHSRNLRVQHESLTPFAADIYPGAEFHADLLRASGGETDPTLAQRLIAGSAEVIDWLAGVGVQLQPTASGLLPRSRKTVFLLGGGTAMINALYATAEQIGVMIGYDAGVSDLRLEQDRVVQVQCRQGDATWTLAPGAVIACCGGSQASRDWLRTHWGEVADGFINRGTPFATGDVLASLLRQGAAPVGDPHRAYLVAVDGRSPADDGGIVTRIRCMPAGIVVNTHGQRIHDEGGDTASTRYSLWGQRLTACPAQTAYLILDARGMREAPPSLYPPIFGADLHDLALALDIPPSALAATVARYNAAVRPPAIGAAPADWHTDGLTPPKSHHALRLDEPPFGAYPMRPGITFTYYGLRVDPTTRVRLGDGRAITNLFAAGMIMAPNLIGRGYVSGLALTIGIVFGRIAGAEAARHVGR